MSNNNKPAISSTPAYNEQNYTWYTSLEGNFFKEDTIKGTSAADSMDTVTIPFLVPEGQRAVILAFLNVDDWGTLTVTDKATGTKQLEIRLTPDVEPAGPRGGHTEWSKMDHTMLQAGQYDITVTHQNTTYPAEYDPRYNVSKCRFTLSATTLPDHDSHAVTTSFKGKYRQPDSKFELEFTINLKSTCSGAPLEQRTFSEPEIVSFTPTEKVMVNSDGKVHKIVVKAVNAHLMGEPIYDEATQTCAQKVALSWTIQSWDPMAPDYTEQGIEQTFDSSVLTPGWATLYCDK